MNHDTVALASRVRSPNKIVSVLFCLFGFFVVFDAREGRAGQITGIDPTTVGNGILTPGSSFITAFLNAGPTDGIGFANLLIINHKELFGPPPTPFDVVLNDTASAGVTDYQVRDTVFNLYGLGFPPNPANLWTDFQLQLGFGVGQNFVQAGALSNLAFSGPFVANLFSDAIATPRQTLTFSGRPGISGPGTGDTFEFILSVPDLQTQGNKFTLREIPSVGQPPVEMSEPASLLLLGAACASLSIFNIFRHRRSNS